MFNLCEREYFSDLSALTNLAKRISGNPNILIQIQNCEVVFTDSRTIFLPEIYAKDIKSAQGLIAHEAGHIGYGSFELAFIELINMLSKKYKIEIQLSMKLINLIEDVRINNINKEKFPGFYENLRIFTYKILPQIKARMLKFEDLLLYINLFLENYEDYQEKPRFSRLFLSDSDWNQIIRIKSFIHSSIAPNTSIIACQRLAQILSKFFPKEKLNDIRSIEDMMRNTRLQDNTFSFIDQISRNKRDEDKTELELLNEQTVRNFNDLDFQSPFFDDFFDMIDDFQGFEERDDSRIIKESIEKNVEELQDNIQESIKNAIKNVVNEALDHATSENETSKEELVAKLEKTVNEIRKDTKNRIQSAIESILKEESKFGDSDNKFESKELQERIQQEVKKIESESNVKLIDEIKNIVADRVNNKSEENNLAVEQIGNKVSEKLIEFEKELSDKINENIVQGFKTAKIEINNQIHDFKNVLQKYFDEKIKWIQGEEERKRFESNFNVFKKTAELIANAEESLRDRLVRLDYDDNFKSEVEEIERSTIDAEIENENMVPINLTYRAITNQNRTIINKMSLIFSKLKNQLGIDNFQKKGRLNSKFIKSITSDYKFKNCFTRKIKEKELRLLILVDISGSMEGVKLECAKTALVMLCESLRSIARVKIVLFTGEHDAINILLKDFFEEIDPNKFDKFGRHRDYCCNLDGLSIKFESDKLEKNDIIIVISDGQPSGGDGYGLEDAIKDIKAVRKRYKVFAFSIDAKGTYLNQLYDKNWILASSRTDMDLGEKLAQLCKLILKEWYC